MNILRGVALGDAPGAKVTREIDTKMGRFPGKEFLVERGPSATRARGFVIGSSIYLLRAVGTREQVDSADSTLFLDSCRLQVVNRPPVGPANAAITGGGNDPEFKDLVPTGVALVGLEVGLGKFGPTTVVKSVRAVLRAGDEEAVCEWHGPTGADVVTETVKVVAKPGYAVGAITVKTGPGIYGLSVTFMKIAGARLDPKDSYESAWVGANIGPAAVKLGGTGESALGLIGKSNATTASGLGLLYKEVKAPEVKLPGPAAKAGDRGPRIQGGPFDPEYRDATPPNGALVGLEIGLGKFFDNDVVKAIRPVYRVGDKESVGEQFGTDTTRVTKIIAKPGYAVGAITLKNGLGVDGLSITFMKLTDGKLDPKDSYESQWVGGMGGGGPVRVGGDGSLVVGVLVKANAKDVSGLGLIYEDTNKPGLDAPWPPGVPTKIQGGPNDREFRQAGPAGSLLVGVEAGVGRFVNRAVVKSVRPVFRAGDKDTPGEWQGPTAADMVKETVKVVAKPGYAVGAITVKTGLGVNGFSVTFMKVTEGKLDPKDSYESEWVGSETGGAAKIGDGTPVIGLIGKARADTVSGLGLLNPAPAKK